MLDRVLLLGLGIASITALTNSAAVSTGCHLGKCFQSRGIPNHDTPFVLLAPSRNSQKACWSHAALK
jgi:hypothetical protein